MNFNNPIPRAVQPLRNEGSALRSVRDSDVVALEWKKAASNNNQLQSIVNNVESLKRQLNLMRRRQPGYPIQTFENYFPFKVYQPTQASLSTQPGAPFTATTFDQSGKPIMALIDSNNPTDETANPPTYNPTTDYWRFWLVRDGICEVRPNFSIVINYGTIDLPNDTVTINNFALQQLVANGTDGIYQPFDEDAIGNTQGYFINVGPGFAQYSYGGCIIVPGTNEVSESQDPPQFFFWAEIEPDSAPDEGAPIISIKGRRFSHNEEDPYFGTAQPAFSPFVIPIASLSFGAFSFVNPPLINQYTYNHIINRWQAGTTPMDSTGVLIPPVLANLYTTLVIGSRNYRGNWQTDVVIQNQAFYPGDEVTFTVASGLTITCTDSVTSVPCYGNANLLNTYVCIKNCILSTGDPSTSSNFVQIASAIVSTTP